MNYYPFHIGDYVSATRHLSWEEDAAFRRLLDTYYTTEKPLPVEVKQVCRLVLAQSESQREAVETVLNEFFQRTESGWINRRADIEIAAMREKQQKQRDKANKRWNKPRPEHGNAPAMPQHNEPDAVASKSDADAMPPTPTPTPIDIAPTPKRVDAGPLEIGLPTNTGEDFAICQSVADDWRRLFPAVDVGQELRSMRAWLLANPAKRKTERGMMRFATAWLTKKQDTAPKVIPKTNGKAVAAI